MNFSIEGKEIVEIKCVDIKHLAQSAKGGGGGVATPTENFPKN